MQISKGNSELASNTASYVKSFRQKLAILSPIIVRQIISASTDMVWPNVSLTQSTLVIADDTLEDVVYGVHDGEGP